MGVLLAGVPEAGGGSRVRELHLQESGWLRSRGPQWLLWRSQVSGAHGQLRPCDATQRWNSVLTGCEPRAPRLPVGKHGVNHGPARVVVPFEFLAELLDHLA